MEEQDLQNIWKKYEEKLANNMDLDSMSIQNIKRARSVLDRLMFRRLLEASFWGFFLFWLLKFIIANFPTPQFVISGGVLVVFGIIGFIGCLWEIFLIQGMNYTASIVGFQEQLEKLKITSLRLLRMMFLSAPIYMAYIIIGFKVILDVDIYAIGDLDWWVYNIILSIGLIPLSIWFYQQMSYKSKRRWVKKLIRDNGGKQIYAAMEFLSDIEGFKEE